MSSTYTLPPAQSATALASRWDRFVARVTDGMLIGVPLLMCYAGALLGQLTAAIGGPTVAIGVAIFLLVFVWQTVLLARFGQSIGKRARKFKMVCATSGQHAGFLRTVVVRHWLNAYPVCGIPALYAMIDGLFIFRSDCRCLRDVFAGTAVVQSTQDDQPRPARQVALVPPILHAAVWLALAGSLYFLVPLLKKVLADYGVRLPRVSIIALSISDWVVDYGYLLPFFLFPLLAVDWLVFASMGRQMKDVPGWWLDRFVDWLVFASTGRQGYTQRQKRLWSGVMFALPVGVAVFALLAFGVALLKLL